LYDIYCSLPALPTRLESQKILLYFLTFIYKKVSFAIKVGAKLYRLGTAFDEVAK